jgi:DNA-binding HxlR family transcriptional regulator
MAAFVQYCPIAIATDVIGDRWTPLVLRELLLGSTRFNEIQRGLPRISRSLLSGRLRRLEHLSLLTRSDDPATPRYALTPAGADLAARLVSLGEWAVTWSLGDPTPEQVDPHLLLWRMHRRLHVDHLPAHRVTIQFDFARPHALRAWMVLDHRAGTVCVQDPGYEVDLTVHADAAALQRVWIGRLAFDDALRAEAITVVGPGPLVRGFPQWFTWSPFRQLVAGTLSR